MKHNIIISLCLATILIAVAVILGHIMFPVPRNTLETFVDALPTSTAHISALPNVEHVDSSTASNYDYLFTVPTVSGGSEQYSNIVGYFAHGAFVWYVPDWLPVNWTIANRDSEGMTISPKVRKMPTFSDIIFSVSTSTEVTNAMTIYQNALARKTPYTNLVINEVFLNKHAAGSLSLDIETDTRIYHIETNTNGHINDAYFMDGAGKTLIVTFDADEDAYAAFAAHIRDLVEGIGAPTQPQG